MFWLIANNYVNRNVNKLSVFPIHQFKKHSRQNFQEYRAQRSEFLEYQKNEKNVTALDFSDSENFSGFSLKSATMAQIFLRHIQYSINDGKLSGQKVHHH